MFHQDSSRGIPSNKSKFGKECVVWLVVMSKHGEGCFSWLGYLNPQCAHCCSIQPVCPSPHPLAVDHGLWTRAFKESESRCLGRGATLEVPSPRCLTHSVYPPNLGKQPSPNRNFMVKHYCSNHILREHGEHECSSYLYTARKWKNNSAFFENE